MVVGVLYRLVHSVLFRHIGEKALSLSAAKACSWTEFKSHCKRGQHATLDPSLETKYSRVCYNERSYNERMLQRTNATTNECYNERCCNERMLQRTNATTNECYNERCCNERRYNERCYNERRYNERMLQRTMLQRGCNNERGGLLSADVARACAWRVRL